MTQLKATYNDDKMERLYREDQDGKEYLYYRDKKHRIIIRNFTLDDATIWFNCMFCQQQVSAERKKSLIEQFKRIENHRDMNDDEFSLMVTELTGKMIAEIDVKLCEDDKSECDIEIVMKDEYFKKQRGEQVIKALCSLHRNHGWQDAIYLKDGKGNRKLLQVS